MMLVHPRSNPHNKRVFTREEDELILANARGEMSQSDLQQRLRCGTETLHRRASELGLQIKKYIYNNTPRQPRRRVMKDKQSGEVLIGYHEIPHVGDDLLLKQLYLQHGERLYESLRIKSERQED